MKSSSHERKMKGILFVFTFSSVVSAISSNYLLFMSPYKCPISSVTHKDKLLVISLNFN
jgi:hypothetical protein